MYGLRFGRQTSPNLDLFLDMVWNYGLFVCMLSSVNVIKLIEDQVGFQTKLPGNITNPAYRHSGILDFTNLKGPSPPPP